MAATKKPIVVLGIFVADTAYRADRQPKMGETILGHSFVLGPGGKGSNQSVAAAMAGGSVHIITRLGNDAFADIAAFNLCEDSAIKQQLLETLETRRRLQLFADSLKVEIQDQRLRRKLQGPLTDDQIVDN